MDGRTVSAAATVHGVSGDAVELDVVEAAHVDGAHIVALAVGATSEGTNAAHGAEQVMDLLLVEEIVREDILTRLQRELIGGHEAQHRARLAADGTVAGDGRLGEVELNLEANLAAVTAAGVCFWLSHVRKLARLSGGMQRKSARGRPSLAALLASRPALGESQRIGDAPSVQGCFSHMSQSTTFSRTVQPELVAPHQSFSPRGTIESYF